MKKVAIVGVEGSGKTVMLAGLGELYSKPDEQGYFLSPKNFATASYVADKIARMRQGEWPTATAEDVLQGLDWSIRRKGDGSGRPQDVCEVSCLDFAGEVYRAAFGIRAESADNLSSEAESLKSYVQDADDVIVLINLRDIIVNGIRDKRVQESLWITKSILQYALESRSGRKEPRAALVLTQADSYADTIRACGGAKGVLEEYLRDVANNYGWLDIFAVSAVDKTSLDADGNVKPAPDFTSEGLTPLLTWILGGADVASYDVSQDPKLGDTKTITLPGGAAMEMVWCPATTSEEWKHISRGDDFFWMGSSTFETGRYSDEVQHRVTLTRGFWMGRYEVTQRQWISVMGNNPSHFKGDNRPVEQVSWDCCQEFIRKVNASGRVAVALPTAAQWEYACRAGTTTPFNSGSTQSVCGVNYDGKETTDVGSYSPNSWGLYDMHGNVWEWCADWYGEYTGDATDPRGPVSGVDRIYRGGRWYNVQGCRSANRNRGEPGYRSGNIGFRLVCSLQ